MVTPHDQRYLTLPPTHKLVFAVIYRAKLDLNSKAHAATAREFLADIGLLDHAETLPAARTGTHKLQL